MLILWTSCKKDRLSVNTDTVFVTRPGGTLIAINATNGQMKWRKSIGGIDGVCYLHNNKFIAANSTSRTLNAFNANDGSTAWSRDFRTAGNSIYNSYLYTRLGDSLLVVDLENGGVVSAFSIEPQFDTRLAMVANNSVFVKGEDSVYCIDLTTHSLKWSSAKAASSPSNQWLFSAYGNQTFFFFDESYDQTNSLEALDANTGNVKWRVFINHYSNPSCPVVYNGVLYFGDEDRILHALSMENGNTLWTRQFDGYMNKVPAFKDGSMYVYDGIRRVYALEASTGNELWSVTEDQECYFGQCPIILNDQIIMTYARGIVISRSINGGQLNWRYEDSDNTQNSGTPYAMDEHGNAFYPSFLGVY